MGCRNTTSIESFSISSFSAMKTVTVAIVGGRGALLVDCISWIE